MSDTIKNISIPIDQWVDLYAASGITVGTRIKVQNIAVNTVLLYSGAVAPASLDYYAIIERGVQAVNDIGDSGAWAYAKGNNGLVNVKVVT